MVPAGACALRHRHPRDTAPQTGKTGGMATDEYDLIVLGGGPVGENVADRAVQGGLTAVIVESELLGGECSYWACMPSKALLRSGQALRAARQVFVEKGFLASRVEDIAKRANLSKGEIVGQVGKCKTAGGMRVSHRAGRPVWIGGGKPGRECRAGSHKEQRVRAGAQTRCTATVRVSARIAVAASTSPGRMAR